CVSALEAQPLDTSRHLSVAVYTWSSVVTYVAQAKLSRPPERQKMQSSLLEIIEAYSIKHNVFLHSDTVGILKDTIIQSPVEVDSTDRIHVYIYLKKDVNVMTFVNTLISIGTRPSAWNDSVRIIQA